jgi:PEP-CTERM motif
LIIIAVMGNPVYGDAYASDFGTSAQVQAGDDFILSAGADDITDIHWWGFYSPLPFPPNDAFTIRIFKIDINSGVPDAIPLYDNTVGNAVTRTDTGNQRFEYSVDLAPISLDPGIPYLLSIVNNSTRSGGGGYGNWFWIASDTSSQTIHYARVSDGGAWNPSPVELAFNLTGPSSQSAPEPSTFLLLGAGLAGVGLVRRRQKKLALISLSLRKKGRRNR